MLKYLNDLKIYNFIIEFTIDSQLSVNASYITMISLCKISTYKQFHISSRIIGNIKWKEHKVSCV